MQNLSDWVGKTRTRTECLVPWPIAALAATLDCDSVDVQPGAPIAPCWHWVYFNSPAPTRYLDPDGHERRGEFLPPVELPRRMWAAGRIEVKVPLRIGSEATKTSTIVGVERKQGHSGALCFVSVEHRYRSEGQDSMREVQQIVFTDARAALGSRAHDPVDAPLAERRICSEVMLFRYSALTFNSHRIHFDRTYCREVEGHQDLLIQGPLTATLLMNLARHLEARALQTFRFKAVAPLYVNEVMHLHAQGREDGSPLRLYAAGSTGSPSMYAEAIFR